MAKKKAKKKIAKKVTRSKLPKNPYTGSDFGSFLEELINEDLAVAPVMDLSAIYGIDEVDQTTKELAQQALDQAQERPDNEPVRVPEAPPKPPGPPYDFEEDVKKTIERIGIRMEEVETSLSKEKIRTSFLAARIIQLENQSFFAPFFKFLKSLFN